MKTTWTIALAIPLLVVACDNRGRRPFVDGQNQVGANQAANAALWNANQDQGRRDDQRFGQYQGLSESDRKFAEVCAAKVYQIALGELDESAMDDEEAADCLEAIQASIYGGSAPYASNAIETVLPDYSQLYRRPPGRAIDRTTYGNLGGAQGYQSPWYQDRYTYSDHVPHCQGDILQFDLYQDAPRGGNLGPGCLPMDDQEYAGNYLYWGVAKNGLDQRMTAGYQTIPSAGYHGGANYHTAQPGYGRGGAYGSQKFSWDDLGDVFDGVVDRFEQSLAHLGSGVAQSLSHIAIANVHSLERSLYGLMMTYSQVGRNYPPIPHGRVAYRAGMMYPAQVNFNQWCHAPAQCNVCVSPHECHDY